MAGRPVYVLIHEGSIGTHIEGVYSSLEAAKAAVEQGESVRWEDYTTLTRRWRYGDWWIEVHEVQGEGD